MKILKQNSIKAASGLINSLMLGVCVPVLFLATCYGFHVARNYQNEQHALVRLKEFASFNVDMSDPNILVRILPSNCQKYFLRVESINFGFEKNTIPDLTPRLVTELKSFPCLKSLWFSRSKNAILYHEDAIYFHVAILRWAFPSVFILATYS